MKLTQKQRDYIELIYFNKFLPLYKDGFFWNKNNLIFSDTRVLRCLGKEKAYGFVLLKFMKKMWINDNKTKNFTIANLGAGSGSFGCEIRKVFNSARIIELDINSNVIKRLKKKYRHDYERQFIRGDICKLPFLKNTMDFVITYSTLRYVQDKQKAILEINRVLKREGQVIIAEGRASFVINNIVYYVKREFGSYQLKSFSNISLPNLTFFYYLLGRLKTDTKLKNIVRNISNQQIDYIENVYKLSGSKKGTIYTISWRKK